MELQSISIVSKYFNISVGTLRYYEQIAEILQDDNAAPAIEVFQQNLSEINDEIVALSTVKSIIQSLIERLKNKNMQLQLLDDESLLELMDSLTISKIRFKEGSTMEELNKANEQLNKLTERDVRIIYLPPMTMGAYCCKDSSSGKMAAEAVSYLSDKLIEHNPALCHFNFLTHKANSAVNDGYELWLTVPENMSVPEPFLKRQFDGGLYAAHTIPCGAYDEWILLKEWVDQQDNIENDWSCRTTPETTKPEWLLEEILNYHGIVTGNYLNQRQVDLLLPIKLKEEN